MQQKISRVRKCWMLNMRCDQCLKQADYEYDVSGFWNLWKIWKNALPLKSQSCDCSRNSFVVAACCVNLQRCTLHIVSFFLPAPFSGSLSFTPEVALKYICNVAPYLDWSSILYFSGPVYLFGFSLKKVET